MPLAHAALPHLSPDAMRFFVLTASLPNLQRDLMLGLLAAVWHERFGPVRILGCPPDPHYVTWRVRADTWSVCNN